MVQQPYIGDQGFSDHTLYREGQDDRSDRRSGCVSEYRWRGGCQDQHQAHFQLKFSDQSHLCIAAWPQTYCCAIGQPAPCLPLKMCDLCSRCLWTTRKVQNILLMSLTYSKGSRYASYVSELFEKLKTCSWCLWIVWGVQNMLLVSLNYLKGSKYASYVFQLFEKLKTCSWCLWTPCQPGCPDCATSSLPSLTSGAQTSARAKIK